MYCTFYALNFILTATGHTTPWLRALDATQYAIPGSHSQSRSPTLVQSSRANLWRVGYVRADVTYTPRCITVWMLIWFPPVYILGSMHISLWTRSFTILSNAVSILHYISVFAEHMDIFEICIYKNAIRTTWDTRDSFVTLNETRPVNLNPLLGPCSSERTSDNGWDH